MAIETWRDRIWAVVGMVGSTVCFSIPTVAQVVPDEMLGNERSTITRETIRGIDSDRIDGGARRGQNLFHSFQQFDVLEGRGAYFSNPAEVRNIFSRVTGIDRSEIMGRLGVLGDANLFFMNPNGILFGPNASLDVAGSFVGTTANAIQFGEQGFFSATNPEMPAPLLAIDPGVLFFNQLDQQTGTISNSGNLVTGRDFTLSADTLDLQGQLFAGENLTLQGLDTVRIRDSVTHPFVAASGGQLLVQGDRVVDIFALSHPNSGFVSGGDMVLRSTNQVGGDAHYWSGGNFRIERSDGSLGDLYSPFDPIIRVAGDLFLNNYIGSSLHILAGGAVYVPGTIVILGADAINASIVEDITLSDGTTLPIDGSARPTLDIRAGVASEAIGSPLGIVGSGDFPGGGTVFDTPSGASISIGTVIIEPPDGQILLTNQYHPNLSLPFPDISITGTGISRLGATPPVQGIDARGIGERGSSVIVDSRGSILLAENAEINSSAALHRSGNIKLLTRENILLAPLADIFAYSDVDRGGDINLVAGEEVSLGIRTSVLTSSGGNIQIQANRLLVQELSIIGSPVNNIRDGGNILLHISDFTRINGGDIGTIALDFPGLNPPQQLGNTGNITIETGELEITGFAIDIPDSFLGYRTGGSISSDVAGNANAGDITIIADQVRLLNGGQIRASTVGAGNAGDITIRATDLVEITGIEPQRNDPSKIAVSSNRQATGNGGNLLIETDRLIVSDGAQVQAGVFGAGAGGSLTINATSSIAIFDTIADKDPTGLFAGPEQINASGRGGDITIRTNQLSLLGADARISNEVDFEATGDSGNTVIEVARLTVGDGARISAAALGDGLGGNLTISASELIELFGIDEIDERGDSKEPGGIITLTTGLQDSGDLAIMTDRLIVRDGATISASTFGASEDTLSGTGRAGDISISAESIEVSGQRDEFPSSILTETGRAFGVLNPFSAASGGNLNITTGQLMVRDGAEISTSAFGSGEAGDMTISASQAVQLLGGNLRTRTFGAGNAGDLSINTARLLIQNDGEASASTRNGSGRGGNLSIVASDSVELLGLGGLGTFSFQSGDAGNLSIQTGRLSVRDGAGIRTSSIGSGQAGNLQITASDAVEVIGGRQILGSEANEFLDGFFDGNLLDSNKTIFLPSQITTESASLPTNPAGNLTIEAGQLSIRDGGSVTTSTLGANPGGRLAVNASELVEVIGTSVMGNPSTLSAQTSGLGQGGDIEIETRELNVSNSGVVSASTSIAEGPRDTILTTGRPGNITILNADTVSLTNNASISTAVEASTVVGSTATDLRGNINIQTRSLSLINNAEITASTFGQGNAGSIIVRDANQISLSSNSTISTAVEANAIGQGGNITINTDLLNLTNRSQITSSTSGTGNTGQIGIEADQIRLTDHSGITSSVNSGAIGNSQQITLDVSDLFLNENSFISAATSGAGNAGSIQIQNADRIRLNNSTISTAINPGASAIEPSNIILQTRSLNLTNGSNITASTADQGRAGNIIIEGIDRSTNQRASQRTNQRANQRTNQRTNQRGNQNQADRVVLSESVIATDVQRTGVGQGGNIQIRSHRLNLDNRSRISAQTRGQGEAGSLDIIAAIVSLANGSRLQTNTSSDQNAGNITLTVNDEITIEGIRSGIFASTTENSRGNGGFIQLGGDTINLDHNGQISAQSQGRGEAGRVQIQATGDLNLNARSTISTQSQRNLAGNVSIQANQISLSGRSTISTQSQRNQAGNVSIQAEQIEATDSDITTSSAGLSGGSINLVASEIRLNGDSDLRTNSRNDGGNIALNANFILALDDSDIFAFAGARGGDIQLDTPAFFGNQYQSSSTRDDPDRLDGNDRTDINASGQVSSGEIATPDTSFIQNSLTDLPETAIDTQALISSSCVVRQDEQSGSFTMPGAGGLPERPGELPRPRFPTGAVRSIPDTTSNTEAGWQMGDPIVEPQGVYQLPNGRLVLSRECH